MKKVDINFLEKSVMKIFKALIVHYILITAIFFIGRVVLLVLYFDKVSNSDVSYWLSFLYGLRMDTITVSILFIIPVILMTLSPKAIYFVVEKVLKYYFLMVFALVIYIEISTFPFIAQYDVRPNYLFVEYLIYPKEVFSMIFAEYKAELFIAFVCITGFVTFYLKCCHHCFIALYKTSYFKRIVLFIPLAALLFIGIRSSFGHRPANQSDAMYSSNRMLNEITKNSLYSIGYAMYVNQKNNTKKLLSQYGKMHDDEAVQRVRSILHIQNEKADLPFTRNEKSHFKTDDSKNLVIFIQESMGYQFVEAVGGKKGITPNMNQLAKEGILFKDLYSNGTRSVRGIAGSVAGNFSVPGKGVVKRNKSQSDFFTIASALKPHGYYTSFIYGGESRFDNMRAWFLGNGFDEVIDQPEFKNPSFTGTWGVSDEDMVIRANSEFKKHYKNHQKFATVMFSTSTHSPFDFPENRIELVKGVDKKSVENAVKYADFSIGKFFELAKKEQYYKDTVFVVIADHNVRVYGEDMIPVDMFHVPAVILGENIKPYTYNKMATQPDVLATALDLIGLDLNYPILGHSIFSDDKQNISFIQFHNSYGLRVDDKIAIIRPRKKASTFLYKNQHLVKTASDKKLEKDALAFIVTLDYLYNNKLYK